MDEPPERGDERGRRATGGPPDGESVPEDDFYRGGGAAPVRAAPEWPRWWPGGFDAGGRPPVWLTLSLSMTGVVGGFLVFSAAWDLAGDGLFAVSLATLAGLGVGAGAMLVGGYAWRRSTEASGSS